MLYEVITELLQARLRDLADFGLLLRLVVGGKAVAPGERQQQHGAEENSMGFHGRFLS